MRHRIRYTQFYPRSRGSSGALHLKSATAGAMPDPRALIVKLPYVSGAEVRVLRNENP